MKIKVIGWTTYDDYTVSEGEHSFASNEAIIDDIRKHGYEFTGWDHQETPNCVPVLSDGKSRTFSQRGWGGIMGEAYGLTGDMDYCKYAFNYCFPPERCTYPQDERDIVNVIKDISKKYLSDEEMDLLFYTPRADWALFPRQEGVGDLEIVEVPTELDEDGKCYPIYLIPNKIFEQLIETSPYEEFELQDDEYIFFLPPIKTIGDKLETIYLDGKDTHVMVAYKDSLRYIAPGDTLVVGNKHYEIKDVDRYQDMPKKVGNLLSYALTKDNHYNSTKSQLLSTQLVIDITLK